MIQTKTLDRPSCGAELLDPIYDLEMVDGGRRRLTCGNAAGSPSGLTFEVVVDDATDLPCMAVTDGGETARASILGLTMRGWRFAGLGDGEARP